MNREFKMQCISSVHHSGGSLYREQRNQNVKKKVWEQSIDLISFKLTGIKNVGFKRLLSHSQLGYGKL